MSALPFVWTATPEDPIRCDECRTEKDHGQLTENLVGRLECAACTEDKHTALLVHSMEETGHAPKEADNVES
jgi:hypothetical protein